MNPLAVAEYGRLAVRVGIGLALVAIALFIIIFGGAQQAMQQQGTSCGSPVIEGGTPTQFANQTIPPVLYVEYIKAGAKYDIPWNVLAAINWVESSFGQNKNVSSAGAMGPMQFIPETWKIYRVDGNGDGKKDVLDYRDAIPSAANHLAANRKLSGGDLKKAIWHYNQSWAYVNKVLGFAERFATAFTRESPIGQRFGVQHDGAVADDDELRDSLKLGPRVPGTPRKGKRKQAQALGPAAVDTSTGASAIGYPLAKRGTQGGGPAEHRKRALGNWQSDNALDILVPMGTRVLAVADGTIVRTGGSAPYRGSGVIGGYSVTLETRTNAYFYTHLLTRDAKVGDAVKKGDVLGTSGFAANRDHLHIGIRTGDPLALWGDGTNAAITDPCATPQTFTAGADGKVEIAAGANLPGRPITPETMAFLTQVAGIYGKKIIVTTGTNHHPFVQNTNRVSDHYSGHGADFGMVANGGTDGGPVGDEIARACMIAAGATPEEATKRAKQSGDADFNAVHNGLDIQCLWKTMSGGNHYNHVHIGAKPTGKPLT